MLHCKFDYMIRKRPIDVDPVLRQIRLKRLMRALMLEPQPQSLMGKIYRDLAIAEMLLRSRRQ